MKNAPVIAPDDPRLATLVLKHGSHDSPDAGLCFMEAVAWMRNMKHSDAPKCVAGTIRAAGITLNDGLRTDEQRTTLLRPLIPVVVGTATNAKDEETRAWLATDFLVREVTPAWLDCAGLTDQATKLRAAEPLTSAEIARGIASLLKSVRQDAGAAGAAARAAKPATHDVMYAAALARLQPTADRLNLACVDLITRMSAVGR
jgi:CheY-like chemotaxis protein